MLRAYLLKNWILSIVGAYFLFSMLLNITTGIDICIPCLWRSIFHVQCPGCGLTTATMHLLKFNFSGAYQSNRLVFVVIPLVAAYLFIDFYKFLRVKK